MTPRLVTTISDLKNKVTKPYCVYYYDEIGLCGRDFTEWAIARAFIESFPSGIGVPDDRISHAPTPLNPLGANDFFTIANSIADVLTKKNELYGNSALNPIAVFAGKTKVGQRADDKVSGIQNSPTLRKNDVADLIGYLVLMCKENNWTDFSDQID